MQAGETQVCQDLRRVDGRQRLHDLQLHDQLTLYQKVDTVGTIDPHVPVHDRHRNLALDS